MARRHEKGYQRMSEMALSDQQSTAVDRVVDWYKNPWSDQVFRLFGYAGTGKTTIARQIVAAPGLTNTALYAAYTGKAAYVLRTKGASNARTIHSLIYLPKQKARERLDELTRELAALEETAMSNPPATPADRDRRAVLWDKLRRDILVEERRLAQPSFILNEESELGYAPLLVVDEVSMVGHEMARDLLSFGVKLLVLGDPMQLPPVKSTGFFIDHEPDMLLSEIHRSALDSPVTNIATRVRLARPGDPDYGMPYGVLGESGRMPQADVQQLLAADQVLVGKNVTRWQYINLLRTLRGQHGSVPMAGDRIVCKANNGTVGVFNGQQFTVDEARVDPRSDDVLNVSCRDDDGMPYTFDSWAEGFTGFKGETEAKKNRLGRVVVATFSQAVTVHTSQGSQWPRVVVVDESGMAAYGSRRDGGDMAAQYLAGQRWLYTAVTRAAEQIKIIGGGR